MRQTKILLSASHCTIPRGLCRLSLVPAGRWPFPALSLLILPWVPGPLPRWLLWCIFPFLPIGHRPSPLLQRVGYPHHPHWRLPSGLRFEAAVIPLCSGPQVCSPLWSPPQCITQSGSDFYIRAEHLLLPERCTGYAIRPNREIDGRGL